MGSKAALLVTLLFLSLALETQAENGGHNPAPTPLTMAHTKKSPRRPPSPPKHRPRHPTPHTPTPPPYTPSAPEPTPYAPTPAPSAFLEHGAEGDYAGVQAATADYEEPSSTPAYKPRV
ncbi:hypothetical protein ZWY2020_014207 [Hordeum vulgare]|nr:hypothetical protein ZWY2020_014207 [Hordeum vulgare]